MKRGLFNKRWRIDKTTDTGFTGAQLSLVRDPATGAVSVFHNEKLIGSAQGQGEHAIVCPIKHPETNIPCTLEVFLAQTDSKNDKRLSVGLLIFKDRETGTGVFTAEEEGETIDPSGGSD